MLKKLYAKLEKKRTPDYYTNIKAPAYAHFAMLLAGILGLKCIFRTHYKRMAFWRSIHCIVNPLIWWFPHSLGCARINKFCADRWLRRGFRGSI
jgi:hypothetical protein